MPFDGSNGGSLAALSRAMEALLAKLMLLLHGKGALALALALSTGGLVVTGTVDGVPVDLRLSSIEGRSCMEAVLARTEARLEIEERYADGRELLRRLRDAARDRADERNARIDESALADELQRGLDELKASRDQAVQRLQAAADLTPCEDGDGDTGAIFDLARLKQEYTAIVHDARLRSQAALDRAESAFDRLVASATPRPAKPPKDDTKGDTSDSDD
jgi:hypothetical protein